MNNKGQTGLQAAASGCQGCAFSLLKPGQKQKYHVTLPEKYNSVMDPIFGKMIKIKKDKTRPVEDDFWVLSASIFVQVSLNTTHNVHYRLYNKRFQQFPPGHPWAIPQVTY